MGSINHAMEMQKRISAKISPLVNNNALAGLTKQLQAQGAALQM